MLYHTLATIFLSLRCIVYIYNSIVIVIKAI